MSSDLPAEDLEEIASRFSSLRHILMHDDKGERPSDIRDMLIDRLRDALDRRLPQLASGNPAFIAGSFLLEEMVHQRDRTEISQLRHRDLGTFHALKTLIADHANDDIARRLLLREARIGMSLLHPCLIQTQIALRLADGRPAIVMEWASQSLSQRLSSGSISVRDIIETMRRLLSGLQAIHEAGYVHCDISPGNLLFADDGFSGLKIADFGVALEQGHHHHDLDIRLAGSPSFMAPEQADDKGADPRSDLYSAGCILNALVERCEETGLHVKEIGVLALDLTQTSPSRRPASAKAALDLLNDINR